MYDSTKDTLEHIQWVQLRINETINELLSRSLRHDNSKLHSPEKEYFDEWTPKLSGVTYGSDEYREMLDQMRPAIDHHQKINRHHPEFFENGITGMNLIDLIEMLADWKAATMRHDDGNIIRSLEINTKRFDMPEILVEILENTLDYMGWFS